MLLENSSLLNRERQRPTNATGERQDHRAFAQTRSLLGHAEEDRNLRRGLPTADDDTRHRPDHRQRHGGDDR
jgi:hypothetical protein